MRNSTYRFTLDLHKLQSQMSIAVFAYDSAVRLIISLTDGGNPYHIDDGCRAVFIGKRPDGKSLVHNCMIEGNAKEGNTRIIYDFNDQTAAIEGITECQIRLYSIDSELITAPGFIIVVKERLVDITDLPEDSLLDALDTILITEAAVKAAENERFYAEEARVQAEEERDKAEKGYIDESGECVFGRIRSEVLRELAENERAEAEKKRCDHEATRDLAETQRILKEDERVIAEIVRADEEAIRVQNETSRVASEASRVASEAARVQAEKSRVDYYEAFKTEVSGVMGTLASVVDGGAI